MTAPRLADPNAPNLLLMLKDHLPNAIRSAKERIATHEAAIVELRAELEKLVKHAAVEGIQVDDPAPIATLSLEP